MQVIPQVGNRLALQAIEQLFFLFRIELAARHQRAEYADMANIDGNVVQTDDMQHRNHQADHFEIGADRIAAEYFGADLQWRATGMDTIAGRVQQVAAVAQSRYPVMTRVVGQQVCVDACNLRRHVRAYAHQPTRQLVDQGKGAGFEVVRGAGQQGFAILDHGRHHQVVSPAVKQLQYLLSQVFDRTRIGRQGFLHTVRQDPARLSAAHGFSLEPGRDKTDRAASAPVRCSAGWIRAWLPFAAPGCDILAD